MTTVQLFRHDVGDKSTCGLLLIDGAFFCYTLENSEKRIGVGNYALKLSYSPTWTKHMIAGADSHYEPIRDILRETQFSMFEVVLPGTDSLGDRDQILIHPANTWDQLLGCVAPGDAVKHGSPSSLLPSSRETYCRLYLTLYEKMKRGHVSFKVVERVPILGTIDLDAIHSIS